MTWYYHSGKTVRPIPVKKGLSKSVRPNSRVEILELTSESKALIRKHELTICGKPKGAKSIADEPIPSTDIAAAIGVTPMARSIAEKGKTTDSKIAPTTIGIPQMTEGELATGSATPLIEEENAEDVEKKPHIDREEVDQDEVLSDDSDNNKGKNKRRR